VSQQDRDHLVTRAAVVRERGGPFRVEDVCLSPPVGDEVLVRIVGVGICHSDVAACEQQLPVPMPIVLGHEGSGIVEAVGSDVTHVKAGDQVVLSFMSCGHCPSCDDDQPAYCNSFGTLNRSGIRSDGSLPFSSADGEVYGFFFGQSSFGTHALAHARNVVPVHRDDVPLALLGPLGCGIQTGAGAVMHVFDAREGASLLVSGGGSVGLSGIIAAVARGASIIILSEPNAARRTLALELGATHVIDPVSEDLTARVQAICPGGVQFALDTTARGDVIEQSFAALARRGTLGLVGVPKDPATTLGVNILSLLGRGITVRGICEGDSDPQTFIPEMIDLYKDGLFPFDRLITTYDFEDIEQAIADQKSGKSIKPVLLNKGQSA